MREKISKFINLLNMVKCFIMGVNERVDFFSINTLGNVFIFIRHCLNIFCLHFYILLLPIFLSSIASAYNINMIYYTTLLTSISQKIVFLHG